MLHGRGRHHSFNPNFFSTWQLLAVKKGFDHMMYLDVNERTDMFIVVLLSMVFSYYPIRTIVYFSSRRILRVKLLTRDFCLFSLLFNLLLLGKFWWRICRPIRSGA